ncbi:NAD(P)H-binding protein [Mesorhizobium sp. VK4C]|uniref:NAD(P)H-binding protein n=1 Tax=Mesorhizobium captivum TaxID=3072319 RepID=UPI002A24870E|nr:NAD(P)H-binding protein [Mesorhizobium sp. VK4C]MDX8501767.1 NAD(P)H-binding protein [Mesorhizobium sp. VK4C]
MNELNVRRLIQVSTASYRDPEDGFGLKSKALVTLFKVIARSSYDDIKATGELVAESDLDWTLVRSAFLKDGPADGGLAVGSYGRTKLGMKTSGKVSVRSSVEQRVCAGRSWHLPAICNPTWKLMDVRMNIDIHLATHGTLARSQQSESHEVEIWSDMVCPWCYIATHRFDNALPRVRTSRPGEGQLAQLSVRPGCATHHEQEPQ